jgi:hypothetical protein
LPEHAATDITAADDQESGAGHNGR